MKLLVLDGNSILNRAYYGIKLLTTKDGQFTNGIYGFLTTFEKIKEMVNPDAVAIAFDLKKATFRHKMYSDYKGTRKGMPEELAQQMPVLKELLQKLGYKLVEKEGYEADDILGTLAKACEETGNECVLATGDRDSLQLVSPCTTVRLTVTKMGKPQVTLYDEAAVKDMYGVTPKQLIDIKAIQGDTSDNIPGIKGIGEKGAGDLIRKYHDLNNIYENLDTIDVKPAMRKKLTEGKESAYLSRKLGEIFTDVPIDKDLNSYVPAEMNNQEVISFMAKLEFFSLIDKMGLRDGKSENIADDDSKQPQKELVVKTVDNAKIASAVKAYGKAVFTGEYKDGKIEKILFAANDSLLEVSCMDTAAAKEIFEDEKLPKVTHFSKPLFAALEKADINVNGKFFDTMLAAYLLNPSASNYDVCRLCEEYAVGIGAEDIIYNGEKVNDNTLYSSTATLEKLADILSDKIEEFHQSDLLNNIEVPLAKVLAKMENTGVMVDKEGIAAYGDKLKVRIAEIQQSIYDTVGYEFNINSPKQLGVALFEKLGLPVLKKTKSGYSTGAEILEKLSDEHPAIPMILEYRKLAKLVSTYCDGLLKVIGDDGRIHSNFKQTETRTGRISSTEPNLQNIPVRTELGKEMRRFFTAREGWVLVDADYSQIELRVLAHIANDPNMIEAFKDGQDIHAITASQVFNMPLQMVTPIMRSRAKAVNFGIVYGIGAFSLSKDIGVSRKEADNYIKAYLAHYSAVDAYMKNVVEKAKQDGYVETMFNRRRYLPELSASNGNLRAFGERVARNMPIQGTAADIIKIAMIRVSDRLKEEGLEAQLILQVHDELIVEAPQHEGMHVAMILQEEMENAVKLKVPLTADAAMGKTWFDAKS